MKFDDGITYKHLTGVYRIYDTISNKMYIGSTSRCLYTRYHQHLNNLKYNKHPNLHLQRLYNKRTDSLLFEVIETVEADKCILREQWWINSLNPAININPSAVSRRGVKVTEETKDKLRGRTVSLETRDKIKEARAKQLISKRTLDAMHSAWRKQITCSNGKMYSSITEASIDLDMPIPTICHILSGKIKNPRRNLYFSYVKGN
jgi:group I intron endonuclease